MVNATAVRGALAAMSLALASFSAQAATLNLSYSTTAAGTTGSGSNTIVDPNDLYVYGNAFENLTTTLYTPSTGPSAGINFEFYDDYVFTIGAGSLSSITSTLQLGNIYGINHLQARIYSAASNPSQPVLGTPVGGVIEAWSTSVSGLYGSSLTVVVFDDVLLGAGTYVLELRGAVTGALGGGYVGALDVAEVPVPAAAWLMGSALLGLIGARRRN